VSRYREQVAAAVGAVTIRGPTRYSWLGRASRPLPPSIEAELGESERRSYLMSSLREELYASFYTQGFPVPARWGEPEPVSADPWLAAALAQANTGRGSWEPGWTVLRFDDEEAVVASGRLRVRVHVGDCRAPSGAIRVGGPISVPLPKELPELSPGFHTVLSNAPVDLDSWASVVRVYWNITRAGAPALVGMLTSQLNREGVPFRLKVADHPSRFDRCDSAVLYLHGEAFHAVRAPLRKVAAALTAHLRPAIPAFTLALAPGTGLAEDDGSESFGARRCALLAAGIVSAHGQGLTRIDARVDAVAARFAEDGVLIDAPYLEPSLAGQHVL
jgi:HopA1 effector protein family